MIRRVEAVDFRCLRNVDRTLNDFQVLVGPNASGKTTFLDVVALLGDLVTGGLDRVLKERTQNFHDLTWRRSGSRFELAVELAIPPERRKVIERPSCSIVRYEVAIGTNEGTDELSILAEKVLLKEQDAEPGSVQRKLFPTEPPPRATLLTPKGVRNVKTVVNKVSGGNDNFYDETGKGWDHAFRLGPRRSALGNLPEDESKFPVATWLKGALVEGVQSLVLNSALMRKPSPPGQPKRFGPDGSNLPWVVEGLRAGHPDKLEAWIRHVRTALPDITDVRTFLRQEDRHRYLMICYENGLEVPSWTASDGTLRLLALTLPAYLPGLEGIYLIEEPENGIHPRAVESMFQSTRTDSAAAMVVLVDAAAAGLAAAGLAAGSAAAREAKAATCKEAESPRQATSAHTPLPIEGSRCLLHPSQLQLSQPSGYPRNRRICRVAPSA